VEFSRILLANDGTLEAGGALEPALLLAKELGAELYMLLIEERRETGASTGAAGHVDIDRRSAFIVASSERRAREANVPFHTSVVSGSTIEHVVQYAKQNQVDLLVLGTLSRPLARGLFARKLVTELVHKVPCTVLVVKPGMGSHR
jgi:nucleotide-binding universal stress UspA family protein